MSLAFDPSYFLLLFILPEVYFFFFFNDTATTEIYTLSLHDALPICVGVGVGVGVGEGAGVMIGVGVGVAVGEDRKSTRLNSSHSQISYAVFCLKKKKEHAIVTWNELETIDCILHHINIYS